MLKKLWNTRQMFVAAENRDWNKVADYINNGADITARNGEILEHLTRGGQTQLLDMCLTKGLNPRHRDCMLLDIALQYNDAQTFQILTEHDEGIIEDYITKRHYMEAGGLWNTKQHLHRSNNVESQKISARILDITGQSLDDILLDYKKKQNAEREQLRQMREPMSDEARRRANRINRGFFRR